MEGRGPSAMTVISVAIVAVIGLATISVLFGRNAQTSSVISSGGSALSSVITAAVAPVSTASSGTLG